MPAHIRLDRTVAFHETDAAGVAHFSRVLCWAEEAEHALLRQLELPVISPTQGWPRVHVQADYRKPLQAGDLILIDLEVAEIGDKRIQYRFAIRRAGSEQVAVEGMLVSCHVSREGGERFHAQSLPSAWRQRLAGAGATT